MNRRIFLRNSALAMAGIGTAPLWLRRAVAAERPARRGKVLVTVFQRGAADGLNIVVPFGEAAYYAMRPAIAVPAPAGAAAAGAAAIDLDGFFGLHPALAPLKSIYDARQLAIVHAAGSPDPTRSHFDAQDYMESGTPGVKSTSGGWLNRCLMPEAQPSPVRAVALGSSLPRALRGSNSAIVVNRLDDFRVADATVRPEFQSLYRDAEDARLRATGADAFEAISLLESVRKKHDAPRGGAEYPPGRFGESMRQIARLIQAEAGLEVAFVDIGGWDHHVNEAGRSGAEGQLANLLADFARALAAFRLDLGDRVEDVVLVTMSEFGRTARENGTRGTDHGHANVMFVMGGAVKGGKVYGDWPGLQPEQLYEGRDLNVTTDFRDVLGEVVSKQLGNQDLRAVFPGYKGGRYRGILT
jgi:uncharacterized protein (DUF1501 family)